MSVLQVNCPSCSSPVSFQSEFSTHAVCSACDTLLVREGADVSQIGKVAEIQPDGSPLQLGVSGTYGGKGFQILGRIQQSYGDGFWNEWYLIYSDGREGWIGEAMGEYFVNFPSEGGSLPSSGQLALGDTLTLDGETFVVTGTTNNRTITFEGELPFVVEMGQPCQAFDLRSATGRAATIDYSDTPPSLYIGEYVPFKELKFQGYLRGDERNEGGGGGEGGAAGQVGVSNFNCPSCGAPHSVEGGIRSKVLVCEYCCSAVDISDSEHLQVIWQEQTMREKVQQGVSLPLGTVGTIDEIEYKIIGFVKKSVTYEGVNYPWTEYLLYERYNGYRWLVESDGHYNLMETLPGLPKRGGQAVGRPNQQPIEYQGETYKHFQTSTAVVDAVAGEFYWRVKLGESATNFDYVAPPLMLSMEASQTGFIWSLGRYMTHDEVRKIFGIQKALKMAVGVAPNQPNPYIQDAKVVWKTFWACTIASIVLMMTGILPGTGKTIYTSGNQQYVANRKFVDQVSPPINIDGHGNVSFEFNGRVSNRWMFFDTKLVNTKTNKEYKVGRTVENYYGKGLRKRQVRVSGIPAGEYKLHWHIKSGTKTALEDGADPKKKEEKVNYSITLRRGVGVWGWWFMMMIALFPMPLLITARRASFETKRWYNSDHG